MRAQHHQPGHARKVPSVAGEQRRDALATSALMYKETAPKKAKTFAMASLLKRMRNEGGKATAAAPTPGV